MFKISELAKRDFVNIVDGAKLGPVKDVHIDPGEGVVKALVLQGPRRFKVIPSGRDVVVPWNKVKVLGIDTVLVEIQRN